jgi:hypothetical protein
VKKRRKGMKKRKTPETTLTLVTSMMLETLEIPETSDVLYVEMRDMCAGSAQRSS